MEKSVFDPQEQNSHLESKIVVALERISEAFRVLLWQQSKEFGLSPIQIQLLVFIGLHQTQHAKVSYLAQEFNLTKPTVSDVVKVLETKGLIEKIADPADTRSYSIRLSAEGEQTAQKLVLFSNALKAPVQNLDPQQKTDLWKSLMTILVALQKADVISLQRMCFYCAHYQSDNGLHFCNLLNMPLPAEAIRIDCPEYRPFA